MKSNVIWMYWDQGEHHESLPQLSKLCINQWKKLNFEWSVRVLCIDSIKDYVPEFFNIIKSTPYVRSPQAQSDLLRLLLLSKFGGIWVDVNVYPMLPVELFIDRLVNESNAFFGYWFFDKFIKTGNVETVLTSSWFLVCKQPSFMLIEKWKTAFIKHFISDADWEYFTLHGCLSALYKGDLEITQILDAMVKINTRIPHSALTPDSTVISSFVYKRPCMELLHKLRACV